MPIPITSVAIIDAGTVLKIKDRLGKVSLVNPMEVNLHDSVPVFLDADTMFQAFLKQAHARVKMCQTRVLDSVEYDSDKTTLVLNDPFYNSIYAQDPNYAQNKNCCPKICTCGLAYKFMGNTMWPACFCHTSEKSFALIDGPAVGYRRAISDPEESPTGPNGTANLPRFSSRFIDIPIGTKLLTGEVIETTDKKLRGRLENVVNGFLLRDTELNVSCKFDWRGSEIRDISNTYMVTLEEKTRVNFFIGISGGEFEKAQETLEYRRHLDQIRMANWLD